MEEGLCGGGRKVKFRNFPVATVNDLNHDIIQLLQKKPSHIIVHAGANDTGLSTSRKILNRLLNFKIFILQKLLIVKYIFRHQHGDQIMERQCLLSIN